MPGHDVILVLPYAFADHPSFPEGILKRALEVAGYSVGVIEAPFWQDRRSVAALGAAKLFFAVVTGPVDSIVLNYTSSRTRRREDLYQINGNAFFPDRPPSIKYKIRPDRALIVLANRLRENFPDVPIVAGGVEASLRRFLHYDFQDDRLRRSILLDSRADLLVTGMGEKQIVAIARLLAAGAAIETVRIRGAARVETVAPQDPAFVELPAAEEILADPAKLIMATLAAEGAQRRGRGAFQRHAGRVVVSYPPERYSSTDLDFIYGLSYSRRHLRSPSASPALQMNLFSITSHRGCGGGCSFCSISGHEGQRVVSRSPDSILREISDFARHPQWRGIVSDIGGPTADLYGLDCPQSSCPKGSCLFPDICPAMAAPRPSGNSYQEMLSAARRLPGVRKVLLGSGVRFDHLLDNPRLLEDILRFHTGRFLRVAPEHTEDHVLRQMGKPSFHCFERFVRLFERINRTLPRRLTLAPYIIIGHPGESTTDVQAMRKKLRALNLRPDVQIFTPTPGTLSTAMFVAGLSTAGETLCCEKNVRELKRRKNLLLS